MLVVLLLLFFLLSPLRLFVSGLATLRVNRRLLLQLLLIVLVYRRNKPSTRLTRAIDCLHTILYSLVAPSNKDARSFISFLLIIVIAVSIARTTIVAHIYFGRYCRRWWSSHVFVVVVVVFARRRGLSIMTYVAIHHYDVVEASLSSLLLSSSSSVLSRDIRRRRRFRQRSL